MKKIIPFFISFLFIFSLINFSDNVYGSIAYFTEDFEDFPQFTKNFNASGFITYSPNCCAMTTYVYAGYYSYRCNASTYWFYCNATDTINSMDFFYRHASSQGSSPQFWVYSDIGIIGTWYYTDANDVFGASITKTGSGFGSDNIFQHWYINQSSSTTLKIEIAGVSSTYWTLALSDFCINWTKFRYNSGNAINYFDDIRMGLGSEVGSEPCSIPTGYISLGRKGMGSLLYSPSSANAQFLETKYAFPINASLGGIDLHITKALYTYAYNTTNYYMSINGISFGTSDCVFESGGYAIVRWIIDFDVDEDELIFEFVQTKKFGNTFWWLYGGLDAQDDLNYDGFTQCIIHSNADNYGDGFYNGGTSLTSSKVFNQDVSFKIWYKDWVVSSEIPYYEDTISVDRPNLTYATYEPVYIYATINSYVYDNYIHIEKDGSPFINGFPELVTDVTGLWFTGFTPIETGEYKINLTRNNIQLSWINITIYENPEDDFIVYTEPLISSHGESVKVKYRYYHNSGFTGVVIRSDYSYISDINASGFENVFVSSNTSGTAFTFYATTNQYILLYCLNSNVNRYERITFFYHRVRTGKFDATLSVKEKNIVVEQDETYTQLFSGKHPFNYNDVSIKVNNLAIKIGLPNSFGEVPYEVSIEKLYNATLELKTANGSIVLAYSPFTFAFKEYEGENFFDRFSDEQKLLIAMVIIILLMFIPLLIAIFGYADVPFFIYIIFFCFGIALNVYFGLLDKIVIFLLVVGMGFGAVYEYLR